MQINFFRKNKRGDVTWIPRETVVLVVVGVLLIFTYIFFSDLYAATLSKKDDGSNANFNRIYSDIDKFMKSSNLIEGKIYNFYLGKNYVLIGFDTRWDDNKDIIPGTFKIFGGYNFFKPFKCGNSACLCLFVKNQQVSGEEAKRDQGIVGCSSEAFAGKNVVFLSEGGGVTPKSRGIQRTDANGNYLVFYGEDWGTQPLYIEKNYKKEENRYYIYISKINENKYDDPANIRKKAADNSKQA